MNDKIRYKNSGQSSNEKKIDFNSGSAYWSIEGNNVQFTWFDVPANTSFSTHKHESEQITYVLEGELFFKSENSIYKLSAGDCILIPAILIIKRGREPCPQKQLMHGRRLTNSLQQMKIL